MTSRISRIGARLVLLALVAGVGCIDKNSTPTGSREPPPTRRSLDTLEGRRSDVLTGHVVVAIRPHDDRLASAGLLVADTGTYTSSIGSRGVVEGVIRLRSGTLPLAMFEPAARVARQGHWELRFGPRAGGPERVLRFTAEGGAPPSEVEYRRGDKVVARFATTWVATSGGWRMSRRLVTLYRDDGRAHTIELSFDRPLVQRAGLASGPNSPVQWATAHGVVNFQDGTPACQGELDALDDAIEAYLDASESLIACLAGPGACIASSSAVLYAWRGVHVAEGGLSRCLAAR